MDSTEYVQFVKIGDLNMWELNLNDITTKNFYDLITPFFAKSDLKFRTDLPSINRNRLSIFMYHNKWKWMHKVFTLDVQAKDEFTFEVIEVEIMDKAFKKAKPEFKKAYPSDAFNDVLKATLKSDLKDIKFKI